jgi:hypothetical protein
MRGLKSNIEMEEIVLPRPVLVRANALPLSDFPRPVLMRSPPDDDDEETEQQQHQLPLRLMALAVV